MTNQSMLQKHIEPAALSNDRLILQAEMERIIRTINQFDPTKISTTRIIVLAWWQGELRWARNRVSLASDRRDVQIMVSRNLQPGNPGGTLIQGMTNQTDEESLKGVLRMADRATRLSNRKTAPQLPSLPPKLPVPNTRVWSDATYNVTAATRGELARELTRAAEEEELSSAGYLEMRGVTEATMDPQSPTPDVIQYRQLTQSQCSMTVRHPKGVGSGWAGLSSYDWTAVDGPLLARRALDKCRTSLNPVAVEPGRYTVILEPQAVADIVGALLDPLQKRDAAEMGGGPFGLEYDNTLGLFRSKLGLKVVDERVTISHDPVDQLLGIPQSQGLAAVKWIDKGVLTSLSYNRSTYALPQLNDNLPIVYRAGWQMSGGTTSIEEMIATAKRALIVTRFSNLAGVDVNSVLMSGFTRDGLWLVENGKISKAVKNFRFTESPLYMLNQLEELGPPVPIFRPNKDPYQFDLSPVVVPPLKARDFSFTSMVDAV